MTSRRKGRDSVNYILKPSRLIKSKEIGRSRIIIGRDIIIIASRIPMWLPMVGIESQQHHDVITIGSDAITMIIAFSYCYKYLDKIGIFANCNDTVFYNYLAIYLNKTHFIIKHNNWLKIGEEFNQIVNKAHCTNIWSCSKYPKFSII